MTPTIKTLTIVGTRPEAIKMAPVIRAMNHSTAVGNITCLSGQHPQMARDALELFDIRAERTLPSVQSNGSLSIGLSALQGKLSDVIHDVRPDWVLVHGDTLTTVAGSLAAFQNQIGIAHVEAGLRTGNLSSPWPEEGYRKVVGSLASLHFAPTLSARRNLMREGVPANAIHMVGNTVVDALTQMRDSLRSDAARLIELQSWFAGLIQNRKPVLITAHRRENHDGGIAQIAEATRVLANRFPDHCFILPVHPNPKVSGEFRARLSAITNVQLIEPLDYRHFVFAMERAHLILTDSGGIQEEAPSFGTPVLIMRDHTERPEAVEAGTARLIGSTSEAIIRNACEVIGSPEQRARMSGIKNPFGDGAASQRILNALLGSASLEKPEENLVSLA